MYDRYRDDEIRRLLAEYDIPVNEVIMVDSTAGVADAAHALGGLLALKATGGDVVHKTKVGGVRLNVPATAAADAATSMMRDLRDAGVAVGGLTLERMVPAGIEVVVGATHHPGYGPVVMFGSGGVDVELVGDVRFALAPVDLDTARVLIAETRVGRIVAQRMPHQVDALVSVVVAIAGPRGLLFSEEVSEVDLNPIVVTPETVVAVDARATHIPAFDLHEASRVREEGLFESLAPAIYPRSIAIVGASADETKMGHRAVRGLIDFGFKGDIFPVNPRGGVIAGLPTLRSIAELPRDLDRAIVVLPATAVGAALEQLDKQGVRTAHVYTAGVDQFPPRDTDEGMRVFGPNCIGHYTPYCGITMIGPRFSSKERGNVAFVSQSGTYAGDVVRRGKELGLRFSFVSSVGNCLDVTPAELLAFCDEDDRTSVAAFYLESDIGVAQLLRRAQTVDVPVILFWGGRTAAGSVAAASHTGAMASDPEMLRHLAGNAGVLLVDDIDSLTDALLAVQSFRSIDGDGIALIGSGGGEAVVGADAAERSELVVATLSASVLEELERYRAPGSSVQNPIDIPVWSLYDEESVFTGALVSTVARDPSIHVICAYLDLGTVFDLLPDERATEMVIAMTRSMLQAPRADKPLALVLRSGLTLHQEQLVHDLRLKAGRAGVAIFDSVTRAVNALGALRRLTRATCSRMSSGVGTE